MPSKYLGDGAYIGPPIVVPPRDLTDAEYEEFRPFIEANEAATGVPLYEKPVGKSAKTKESAVSAIPTP